MAYAYPTSSLRFVLLCASVVLSACSTVRETQPPRTADEQLLISGAVDHALANLKLEIPQGTKIWVNAENFDGTDQKYAVSAIHDFLLHHGAYLVADRAGADTVVEIRAGALSTNSDDLLIGIPGMALPVPLTGAMQTPELALVKRSEDQGVAKLGITAYDAKTGALVPYSPSDPAYGFSTARKWLVLSLISWKVEDVLPEAGRQAQDQSRSNVQ
jgi:hypothetical protein